MKLLHASLATLVLSTVTIAPLLANAAATVFGQQEVDLSRFIVMTVPRGAEDYNLLVVEQITNQRLCWQVNNDAAQTVKPLLLNFNFTGICGRGTDSNAFSVRLAGEDLGLKYTLRLVNKNGVVVLVGTPSDSTLPELELGRTRDDLRDYMKIDLDPGWRLTRRTYNGKPLGHTYFTNNTDLATIAAQTQPTPLPSPRPSPTPSPIATPSPSPSPVATPRPLPSPSPSPIVVIQPSPSPSPSTYTLQVQQLYREILQREADAPGLAYHVNRLEQGRSLSQIRQDLQTSPEGRRKLIQQIYVQEIGSQPDPSIVEFYSQRVGQENWSFDQVRQDIRFSYANTPIGSITQPSTIPSSPVAPGQIIPSSPTSPISPIETVNGDTGSSTSDPNFRFPKAAYFVVVPAATDNLSAIAGKVQALGVDPVNIFQRQSPRGPHVAIGPYEHRGLAEQWNAYFRKAGFDARVYYGQ